MWPYILLLVIPILFYRVAIFSKKKVGVKNNAIVLGNSKRVIEHNLILPVFFIMLFLLLAFRSDTLGRDLSNYKILYNDYNALSLSDITLFMKENIFILINWICGHISDSFHFYLVVMAVLTLIPLSYLYCKERKFAYLKIIVYLNLSNFILLFSGIRQSLAISIGIIVYELSIRKKFLWSTLFCFIALGVHHSAFMLFFMYPLCNFKFKYKHLLFVLPVMLLFFIFNSQIFELLSFVIGDDNEKYTIIMEATEAYGFLILSILIAVFCFVITNTSKHNNDQILIGLKNMLLFIVVIQCFAPLNALVMRLNYYYLLFIPLALAKSIEYSSYRYRKLANLGLIVLCLFFTFNYLKDLYISNETGTSTLDTIPYRSVFEDQKSTY